MKPTLLVMAAGLGSRYGGIKQIAPVGPGGEAILEYSVYDALRAGFEKIVFVIRKDIEKDFNEVFGNKFRNRAEIEFVFQELGKIPDGFIIPEGRIKPWGTGHAVLMAKDVVKTPFAAINADDYYGIDAFTNMANFLKKQKNTTTDFAMVGYLLGKTMSEHGSVSRGLCSLDRQKMLLNVTEYTKISYTRNGIEDTADETKKIQLKGDDVVSMNFWGFTPAFFTSLEKLFSLFLQENINNLKSEFYIPSVVDTLIRSGEARVKVLNSNDAWFGITYPEDKPLVQQKLRELTNQGIYPESLWK